MIELKNVSFSYSDTSLFSDFSLQIEHPSFVAILGANGTGKSTLAKLLTGLETPTAGDILINGASLNDDTLFDMRKQISLVFQNPDNQFVGQTVVDDIAFGLENLQMPRDEMINKVKFYLKKLNLIDLKDKAPHELSGGQKQRVALAGALARGSSILILDEATSMLNPRSRQEVLAYVKGLAAEQKQTIIMITHHLEEAAYANRVLVLGQDGIHLDGSPEVVLAEVDKLKELGLRAPFVPAVSHLLKEKKVIGAVHVKEAALVEALCQLD